ncbi:MAG: hypothetical protein J5507_06835 [Clostridia bacterium]|nr:hypothetical protein [Clostridia bacterium]
MIKKVLILVILIIIFLSNTTYATEEIIESQMDALNISSFIKEGQVYTKKAFPDINVEDLLTSAIKGKIDNKSILNSFFEIFKDEFRSAISLITSILVVIIIHSILKAFSENLENNGISQIAYYVEYILIITIIMSNFSKIISIINETISNLVGFISTLVPILLALMSASRKYCNSYTY